MVRPLGFFGVKATAVEMMPLTESPQGCSADSSGPGDFQLSAISVVLGIRFRAECANRRRLPAANALR